MMCAAKYESANTGAFALSSIRLSIASAALSRFIVGPGEPGQTEQGKHLERLTARHPIASGSRAVFALRYLELSKDKSGYSMTSPQAHRERIEIEETLKKRITLGAHWNGKWPRNPY